MAVTGVGTSAPISAPTSTSSTIVDDAIATVLGGGPDATKAPPAQQPGQTFLQRFLDRYFATHPARLGVDQLGSCFQDPGQMTPPDKLPPDKVAGPGQTPPVTTYTVRRGDNLTRIAARVGRTWQQLYWANRDQIRHPDLIHPGQKLVIPPADLEVPPFEYHPLFPGRTQHPRHRHHHDHEHPTPPGKPDGPPKFTPRDSAPTHPHPATDPPKPSGNGSTPPSAPPEPGDGGLPPTLPATR